MADRGQQSAGGQGFESRQRGGASMRGIFVYLYYLNFVIKNRTL